MSRKIRREEKTEYKNSNTWLVMVRWFTDIYILLLVCVYPFIISPGYTVTSKLKYGFITSVTYALEVNGFLFPTYLPVTLILITVGTIMYMKDTRTSLKAFVRSIRFNKTDIFVLLYVAALLISSVVSSYKGELLWGYPSWYMGLASQFILVFIYFIISRFFERMDADILLYGAFAASAVVFIIGILQRLGIDPTGMYTGVPEHMKIKFLSTIGQASWFSSYMMIFLTLSVFIYWHLERSELLWKVSFVHLITGFSCAVVQNTDSAFISIFVVLSILFALSFDSMERFFRLMEIVLIMLLSWRVIGLFQMILGERVLQLEFLSMFFSQDIKMWVPIVIIGVIYLVLKYREKKTGGIDIARFSIIPKIYCIAVTGFIVILIIYIILNSTGMLPEGLSSSSNYLLFDMYWGNLRGAVWHDTVCSYIAEFKEEPVKAIFGAGADQFYHVIQNYVSDQSSAGDPGVVLTNAHNEWMTAFINYGIPGGIVYTGIFLSSIRESIKIMRSKPEVIAVLLCVAAYMSHNFFCYQQFVSTPYIFIIMAVGSGLYLKALN